MELDALYSMIDDLGIIVDDFPMKALVSFSFPHGLIAIDTQKLKTRAEEKVCLAHECGHYSTGSYYNIYSDFDIKQKHENRATKWAITQIIPKDQLESAISKGVVDSYELAEYFDVTEEFMLKAINYYKSQELTE